MLSSVVKKNKSVKIDRAIMGSHQYRQTVKVKHEHCAESYFLTEN